MREKRDPKGDSDGDGLSGRSRDFAERRISRARKSKEGMAKKKKMTEQDDFVQNFIQETFPDENEESQNELGALFVVFVQQLKMNWRTVRRLTANAGKKSFSMACCLDESRSPASVTVKFSVSEGHGGPIRLDAEDIRQVRMGFIQDEEEIDEPEEDAEGSLLEGTEE